MRKPSGQLHVVDHSTEQIVAVLQPSDYRDDLRHWEIKNNIDRLEFKVFTSLPAAATLMQQNLILRETRDGRIIPYTIDEAIQTTDNRSIHIYASAVWVEIAQANYIRPQKIQSKTLNEFMDMALVGIKWERGITEYSGFHTMTIDTFIDPLKFLKDIASLFDLEIQYRVEIIGSQIVGWYVDMIKRRGKNEGKEITLGKDLIGIKRVENTRNICTALIGFVKGEGDSVITIESINKGLPYIVDTQAFQLWNKKGFHRFGFYTPETENQNMTPQRLKTLMEMEIKKRRNAAVTYEAEAQSINRVFGFDHESIFEGDTIRFKDKGFIPPLHLEARAIAGDESFKNPLMDKYEFGDYREITNVGEELKRMYNRILGLFGNKQEILDQLDKLVKEANETASNAKKESEAAKTIAEKVQENIKNNTVEIIESIDPPTTGLNDRKTLWLDISKGKPGILKLWKDGIWDPVVPDVESVKKETLEQVSKDVESAKTELNQKVQTVENKAQEIAGQIVDVKKQVNDKVDQTWIDTQLKDKADKAGVYTKDEIKDGFIGKQVYETDKRGNVQKFQDINTSISQTNEALTQKAEKSELKKTNEGLTQLEQKTNEIKTTADGTKQTLTELKTQVDNAVSGVRNYVLIGNQEFTFTNTNETESKGDALDISKDAYNDFRGKQVYLSFDAETINLKHGVASNNSVGIELRVEYIDGKTSWFEACYGQIVPEGTNRYKRYGKVSQVIEDKEIKFMRVQIFLRSASGTVKMKNFQVEVGNKSSSFKLANEDQVTGTDFTKKTVEIESTIKGITTSVSNIQNEQGKLTDRVTKSEQTADGFKTSIESLTKKDTDISTKLNTVESTVENTKKTISDIQADTTSLKKTTTEIKEEAGKISTKLEQVNARTVGGENWIIDTGKNQRPKTIGMNGGALVNKAASAFSEDYLIVECTDQTDSFYQFHLDNTKMGDYEKGKDMTFSVDLQNDVQVDFLVFQFINGGWSENIQIGFPVGDWSRRSFTFQIDGRATGWGMRLRFSKNTNPVGKKFRFKKAQLEKGSMPTDFSKSTYELEQSVNGIKENITKVEGNQTSFNQRVTEVEKTANGITQNVSKLQETQMQQGKTLTQATTTLEQHSEALNLTMKKKDVEDYVGGLGSINELRNADFEKDLKYWLINRDPGTTVSVDKNLKYKGMNSFQFNTSGLEQNRWWGISGDFIVCQAGEDFVASAYFITDGKPPAFDPGTGCFIEIEYWTSDKKTRITTSRTKVNILNHTWVRCVNTSKAPANTGFVRWRAYNERNGRFWLAAPMMQRGTVAAEFWLHPKDQTDADKMLEDIADRVATEQYNKKVTELERSITANGEGVSIISKKHETFVNDTYSAYIKETGSKLKVLDEGILAEVRKGNLISTINQTAEKVKISAALIDLVGKVEASWLKAGLLIGMTIKTSNSNEYLHMENQVVRFVNQGSDKMVIGFENEMKSKTRNPYIILGEGDGSGKNFGSIYKDGNGVYYRYVDLNGAESNLRLTAQGNVGISAQDGLWVNSKRTNFSSIIEVPAIRFNSLGTTPGSQQGNFWIGNGYKGFGIYYYDNYWKFVQGS
ncbi:phage tail spike protein [Bacillus cereus group sp. BfR-BA-01324]|uniref:phage tail spike protein n=1 Tax=Bacillus cereus group sp. BfR-BA-01324 TaxID=2920300 RepID=UPI001F560A34|nr:phage tail spike protein [Bacillus cereus group sp. BfR-BA-01324]